MRTVAILLLFSGACSIEMDSGRARETLETRGFTGVRREKLTFGSRAYCPTSWGLVTCTSFEARAPWGKDVYGVVPCMTRGTCDVLVLVEFEAKHDADGGTK